MNEVAYSFFDGAAGAFQSERLLQAPQQNQEEQQQQQQYVPTPIESNQEQPFQGGEQNQQQNYYPPQPPQSDELDPNNQQRTELNTPRSGKYYTYTDQTFYDEILTTLHGFEKGKINGATDVGVSDAMASFGFNSILFTVLMVTYEVVYRLMPSIYASRKLHVTDDKKVLELPKSILPLSWVPTVFNASWTTVRNCGGLDAYFFLRFIRLCFRITFVSSCWGMIVLWPVFAGGGGAATGWYYFSMANVPNSSWRLWFPTGFMVLLTIYILFAMDEEFRHYLKLRMEYLAGNVSDELDPQTQHSLIVEELPKELRSDKALYDYFDKMFPNDVHTASVVVNVPDLEKVAAKRKRTGRRLEKSLAYHEATGVRGEHIVGRKRCRLFGIEAFPLKSFGG